MQINIENIASKGIVGYLYNMRIQHKYTTWIAPLQSALGTSRNFNRFNFKTKFSDPKALSRYPEGFKDFWLISSDDVTSTPVDLCAFCNQMHFWHRFQKCHFSKGDCSLFDEKLNMIQVHFHLIILSNVKVTLAVRGYI